MKIYRKLLFFNTFLYLIISCNYRLETENFYYQKENSVLFKDSITLTEYKTVSFPLDNKTGFFNRSLCYFDLKGKKSILSILNLPNQSVYLYDYQEKKILKKIKFQKEGPNGVGMIRQGSSHFMDNFDSLFIFNYAQQRMYLLDNNGKVLKRYNLSQNGSHLIPYTYASRRVIKINNSLFIPCYLETYFTNKIKSSSLLKLDLLTGKKEYIVNYPDVFNKGAWIGPYKYTLNQLFIKEKNSILISFPVDPIMYLVDLNGKLISKKYISSKHITKILPYSSENSNSFYENIPSKKADNYLKNSDEFSGLWFLTNDNKYIRELYLRSPSIEYLKTKETARSSFIIFDENFIKNGEFMLPDKTYETAINFVNNEGLHIAKINEYKKNEDILTFGVFKLVYK